VREGNQRRTHFETAGCVVVPPWKKCAKKEILGKRLLATEDSMEIFFASHL